jgi:hypothetical protein
MTRKGKIYSTNVGSTTYCVTKKFAEVEAFMPVPVVYTFRVGVPLDTSGRGDDDAARPPPHRFL